MKKTVIKITLAFLVLAGSIYNILCGQKSYREFDILLNDVESMARSENEQLVCKWLEIDCPGIGTGDYEACLVTGDGSVCTCGSVTRKCPE